MAYSPQYQAMAVGAVRALMGTENIHLTEAISRVARQMGLDSDLHFLNLEGDRGTWT